MKTYIYTYKETSYIRGCNLTIKVYRIKNNMPFFMGENANINTASYPGNYVIAARIISEKDGYKMRDNRSLISKNIRILNL